MRLHVEREDQAPGRQLVAGVSFNACNELLSCSDDCCVYLHGDQGVLQGKVSTHE